MQRHPKSGPAGFAFLAALSLGLLSCVTQGAKAQGLSADPFVAQVTGEWLGRGEYDGNALTLSAPRPPLPALRTRSAWWSRSRIAQR